MVEESREARFLEAILACRLNHPRDSLHGEIVADNLDAASDRDCGATSGSDEASILEGLHAEVVDVSGLGHTTCATRLSFEEDCVGWRGRCGERINRGLSNLPACVLEPQVRAGESLWVRNGQAAADGVILQNMISDQGKQEGGGGRD